MVLSTTHIRIFPTALGQLQEHYSDYPLGNNSLCHSVVVLELAELIGEPGHYYFPFTLFEIVQSCKEKHNKNKQNQKPLHSLSLTPPSPLPPHHLVADGILNSGCLLTPGMERISIFW